LNHEQVADASALIAHFSVSLAPRATQSNRRSDMKKTGNAGSPSQLIDEKIESLGDWRGEMLAELRELIHEADPDVVEEWKWGDVPVFEDNGIICTGETYKSVVKLTFAKGASLKDPKGLFNSSLEGSVRRAIDFRDGEKVNKTAFKALVREAVALNKTAAAQRKKRV
jgi:hypothetical protein